MGVEIRRSDIIGIQLKTRCGCVRHVDWKVGGPFPESIKVPLSHPMTPPILLEPDTPLGPGDSRRFDRTGRLVDNGDSECPLYYELYEERA